MAPSSLNNRSTARLECIKQWKNNSWYSQQTREIFVVINIYFTCHRLVKPLKILTGNEMKDLSTSLLNRLDAINRGNITQVLNKWQLKEGRQVWWGHVYEKTTDHWIIAAECAYTAFNTKMRLCFTQTTQHLQQIYRWKAILGLKIYVYMYYLEFKMGWYWDFPWNCACGLLNSWLLQ